MLQTEFVRSLQSNYERIFLEEKPDEKKYQYCILSRGGIRGLLPCSIRYINGRVYLYYDITSRQNVAQLYGKQKIDREWVKDFFWSYARIRQELGRFLLDEQNILVYPEQVFQDLGNHNFFFLYLPYSEEGSGFSEFFEFLTERIDYEDEILVECVYKMYDQYEKGKEIYLQEKIFDDLKLLEKDAETVHTDTPIPTETELSEFQQENPAPVFDEAVEQKPEKKGLWGFWGSKKRKDAQQRRSYQEELRELMSGRAVADEAAYENYDDDKAAEEEETEYGKTVYIEQPVEKAVRKLYTPDGRVAIALTKEIITIGKQREETDMVLEDKSVSRVHARIFKEEEVWYLEDLNSTNGTFKNGLRLQPYEKRRLEEGDEVKFGKILFIYH